MDRKEKVFKKIGDTTIYGSNKELKLYYAIPKWKFEQKKKNKTREEYFNFKGKRYYLSEFMKTSKTNLFSEFNGYMGDSLFSGVLIKFSKDYKNSKSI